MKTNLILPFVSSISWLLLLNRVAAKPLRKAQPVHAQTPPRGWNSYDSFSWTISEEEFLQNAELVSQRLHAYGYEYAVVDYLWYRRKVPGAYSDSSGFDVIDEWGRMQPDPDRWPSSKGGKGFTEVAKKVHDMGLKFGIHVMSGLSFQALNANSPILDITKGGVYMENGRNATASDIGIKEKACAWMPHGFMSVNTKLGAGRAFLQSLYKQYAEWGVDFVKLDCVFGDDLDVGEIRFVSEVLKSLDHPVTFSLSPGTSVTPAMAKEINRFVNMYRITGDDWDTWADVASHFDVTRNMAAANLMGSTGLLGRSWPDLDMLPLGWLTDGGVNEGPHRQCKLTFDEQKTQVTLWAMAKSPLMFGGDMRKLDERTYNLITNPTILEINAFSSNNKEFSFVTTSQTLSTKRLLKFISQPKTSSLSLMGCNENHAKGWAVEATDQDHDQVCWKDSSESFKTPYCLYRRKEKVSSDEGKVYNAHFRGKSHLMANKKDLVCINASPKQKLTSKELKRGSLSPCELHANQMWELGNNGTLMNSYSGLCAGVRKLQENAIPGGVRSWIATGRKGEVYLALFNLEQIKTTISTQWSNVAKELPSAELGGSCKCGEVWSGQPCSITRGSLSMGVEPHGVALLVLTCAS